MTEEKFVVTDDLSEGKKNGLFEGKRTPKAKIVMDKGFGTSEIFLYDGEAEDLKQKLESVI